MASSAFLKMSLVIFVSLFVFLQGTLGDIICETMPKDLCAFTISSSGKRCLLENYKNKDGKIEYQCRTSEVVVEKMAEWIESDKCVDACGVDRKSVGISSDSLMEAPFTAKLCAPACYQNCPNIVDLYYNLAAGEGVYLPNLCEAQRMDPHRAMNELLSSGMASGPVASEALAPTNEPSAPTNEASAPTNEPSAPTNEASSPSSSIATDKSASAPTSSSNDESDWTPTASPAYGEEPGWAPAPSPGYVEEPSDDYEE